MNGRKLAFRCYHEKLERMVYDIHAGRGGWDWTDEHGKDWYLDDDSIMQFTGLYDKHGREIYEGDIVTSTHPAITPGYRWLVQWKDAGFEPFVSEERDHGELAFGIKEHLETFEVIGNIYENPELIPQ